MPYDYMDLGLGDFRKRLMGAGLDENDADMGTAAMAPKLYRDRQERLGGLGQYAFTGQGPGQQEIDLSFGYGPKPNETVQLENPVAKLWQQQAQAQAGGFPAAAIELGPEAAQATEANPEYQAPAWEQAKEAPFQAPPPADFEPGAAPPAAFKKTFSQAPEAKGAAGGPSLAQLIASQVRKVDYRPYQPGMSAADDQALNGPPVLGRQEKIGVVRGPGNMADAIAFSAWRANNPGGTADEFFARRGYDASAPAGAAAPSNVVRRAQLGDVNTKNDLWQMVGQDRGAYARAISGGAMPFQIEDEARDRARQAFEMQLEEARHNMLSKDRSFYEGQRQFDARQGMEGARLELAKQQQADEADYKRGLIDVQTLQARTAQRKQMADEMAAQQEIGLRANDPSRKINEFKLRALEQAAAAAPEGQMSPVVASMLGMPSANQQESEGLDLDIKRAQAEMLKRQYAGELTPEQQRAKAEADKQKLLQAGQEYQSLIDTGADEREAQARVASKYGVRPEQLPAATVSMDPRAIMDYTRKMGYPSDADAYKAALTAAFQRNPALKEQALRAAGYNQNPMEVPEVRQLLQPVVQQELARRGWRVPYAQYIAANATF